MPWWKEKIGPLPAGLWVGAVGAGLAYRVIAKRKASTTAPAAPVDASGADSIGPSEVYSAVPVGGLGGGIDYSRPQPPGLDSSHQPPPAPAGFDTATATTAPSPPLPVLPPAPPPAPPTGCWVAWASYSDPATQSFREGPHHQATTQDGAMSMAWADFNSYGSRAVGVHGPFPC